MEGKEKKREGDEVSNTRFWLRHSKKRGRATKRERKKEEKN